MNAKIIDFVSLCNSFEGGELVLVGGRPGVGKTSFCLQAALSVAQSKDRPSLIYSSAYSTEETVKKLLSLQSQDEDLIPSQRHENSRQWVSIKTITGSPAMEARIFIDDTLRPYEETIRVNISLLKEAGQHVHLVVVNFLELLGPYGNRPKIVHSLKSLAKELNVAVIVSTNLRKNVEDRPGKRPLLSDIEELESHADAVVLLSRSDERGEGLKEGRTHFWLDKNKGGSTGKIIHKQLEEDLQYLKNRWSNYPACPK